MVSPFSNATACGAVANGVYGYCKQVSLDCPKKMDSLETTFLLITIPLMIVAFCKLIGASGYGCNSTRLCCRRVKEKKPRAVYLHIEEHSGDLEPYHPTSPRRIAKSSYKAVTQLSTAVALTAIAYVLTRTPLVIRNKACPDLQSCVSWGNHSYQGCEWTIQWLDEVIKELIGGGIECRQLPSPPH